MNRYLLMAEGRWVESCQRQNGGVDQHQPKSKTLSERFHAPDLRAAREDAQRHLAEFLGALPKKREGSLAWQSEDPQITSVTFAQILDLEERPAEITNWSQVRTVEQADVLAAKVIAGLSALQILAAEKKFDVRLKIGERFIPDSCADRYDLYLLPDGALAKSRSYRDSMAEEWRNDPDRTVEGDELVKLVKLCQLTPEDVKKQNRCTYGRRGLRTAGGTAAYRTTRSRTRYLFT